MPAEEYNAAVSGGLKLKGVNSSSKVSKTKKKKAKPESKTTDLKRLKDETLKPADDAEADDAIRKASFKKGVEDNDDSTERNEEAMLPPLQRAGKTEAELRHEERRRKRVCSHYHHSYHL